VLTAVRRALAFDRRLVSCGYRTATLIVSKSIAVAVVAASIAIYAAAVLLAFWRPTADGIVAITLAFAVIALEYGGLGLLVGVTVRGDLEGFFLIIMGSLVDTFLQNPLQNPLANKPVLQYFPSFGPMCLMRGVHDHRWGALRLRGVRSVCDDCGRGRSSVGVCGDCGGCDRRSGS
jgi:ABC-2 type transport system permease protein